MVKSYYPFLLLGMLFKGSAASDEECTAAFDAALNSLDCDTSDLSLDELLSEACPAACQTLYVTVWTACQPGDAWTVHAAVNYTESTLFVEAGHKWRSCDYGYNASSCQQAQNYLTWYGDSDLACSIEGLSVEDLMTQDCPSECQALYDDVTSSCSPGDEYFFVGDAYTLTYLDTDSLFRVQGHKWAACDYGYQPSDCERAYTVMSYFAAEETCYGFTDFETQKCPAACQSLFDNVSANCTPGVDQYTNPKIGNLSKYEQALVYHDHGHKWADCDYAGYTPTTCDIALQTVEGTDFGKGASNALNPACEEENNDPTCTKECKSRIDSVRSDCNATVKFAPGRCFLSEAGTPIHFEDPSFTVNPLGLRPGQGIFPLSSDCCKYYTSNAEGDVPTPASSSSHIMMQPPSLLFAALGAAILLGLSM